MRQGASLSNEPSDKRAAFGAALLLPYPLAGLQRKLAVPLGAPNLPEHRTWWNKRSATHSEAKRNSVAWLGIVAKIFCICHKSAPFPPTEPRRTVTASSHANQRMPETPWDETQILASQKPHKHGPQWPPIHLMPLKQEYDEYAAKSSSLPNSTTRVFRRIAARFGILENLLDTFSSCKSVASTVSTYRSDTLITLHHIYHRGVIQT